MCKMSKHMHTDIYLHLVIQLGNCMMRFNMCVGYVRTQITNRQKMNNSEISTKNIHNLHVCYSDESE